MPNLPDVALSQTQMDQPQINKVGMQKIAVPVCVASAENDLYTAAKAHAFVNLINEERGIHMSRLYQQLMQTLPKQKLNLDTLHQLLKGFLASHERLSNCAYLSLDFDFIEPRKALLTNEYGYRDYPITVTCSLTENGFSAQLTTTIIYSSTCPCSAALSRQHIQQKFAEQFQDQSIDKDHIIEWLGQEEGISATPHSQRSTAIITTTIKAEHYHDPLLFSKHCRLLENVIKTPVQTLVKRQDEQAFARLNAQNLMFCEDAGRSYKQFFHTALAQQYYSDYAVQIKHLESLHAHDAVAEIYSEEL